MLLRIMWVQYYSQQLSVQLSPVLHGTEPTLSPE